MNASDDEKRRFLRIKKLGYAIYFSFPVVLGAAILLHRWNIPSVGPIVFATWMSANLWWLVFGARCPHCGGWLLTRVIKTGEDVKECPRCSTNF